MGRWLETTRFGVTCVHADVWIDTIERFGRAFHRVVGRVSSMAALAATRGKSWYQGVKASRIAFD